MRTGIAYTNIHTRDPSTLRPRKIDTKFTPDGIGHPTRSINSSPTSPRSVGDATPLEAPYFTFGGNAR